MRNCDMATAKAIDVKHNSMPLSDLPMVVRPATSKKVVVNAQKFWHKIKDIIYVLDIFTCIVHHIEPLSP